MCIINEPYIVQTILYHFSNSKLDELYEEVRADRVAFAGYYGEVVDNRKIHCNFKEEAERLRVKHKTNLLAADIYEADTIILQVIR